MGTRLKTLFAIVLGLFVISTTVEAKKVSTPAPSAEEIRQLQADQERRDRVCNDDLLRSIRELRIVAHAFHINCLSAVGLSTLMCTSIDLPEPPARKAEYFYSPNDATWGPGLQARAAAISPRTYFNCSEVPEIREEIRPSYDWFASQTRQSADSHSNADRMDVKVIRTTTTVEWSVGTPSARED